MKRALLILLCAAAAHAEPVLITPTSITYTNDPSQAIGLAALNDETNLINGSGLSETPTLENLATVTHAAASFDLPGNAWTTIDPGGYLSNFFASGGNPQVFDIDLGGSFSVTDFVIWGYHFNSPNRNNPSQLTLEFSSDGGTTFGTPVPITVGPAYISGASAVVNFAPQNGNFVRMTVTANHYDPGNPTAGGDRLGIAEIRFIGDAPSVTYPPSIDVSANDATTVQSITIPIDNGTDSNLEITGIEVVGLDSDRFTVQTSASPEAPFEVAAGTIGNIQISYDPDGIGGTVIADLEITSNDPNSPFIIWIDGIIRDPRIETVDSVTIPPLSDNAPEDFDIIVNNLGTLPLEIDDVFFSGPDALYFELVTVLTPALVIPPGDSAPVTFRFDPDGETRSFSATIELASNDPELAFRNVAVTAQLLKPNPSALSLRLDGNSASIGGGGTGLIPIPGAPFPAEVIDNTEVGTGRSSARNFYYDSDGDLAFTSPGDTSGNTDASLEVDIIVSGPTQVLNFYVDTDGNNFIPDNFAGNFYRMTGLTITLSDGSNVPLDVTQGTPQTFSDPDGGTWSVALNGVGPLTGELTDIVGNIDSVPDGDAPDYHFTLTFSYSTTTPGFSSWAASFGIPDDPDYDGSDNDGIPALIEYALGLSPLVSEPSPGTFDGTTRSFTKGAEAVANGDVTYEIQTSQTLEEGSWTTVTPDVDDPTTISFSLPAGQGKIFSRLVITRIP